MLDIFVVPTFLFSALVIILSPGADTFLLLRSTLRGGTRDGFTTMAGIFTGIFILSVLLVSGVGLLIAQLPGALFWLKIVGAVYLLYLGARSFVVAVALVREHRTSKDQAVDLDELAETTLPKKTLGPYVVGFLTNITNPKVLVFFLAFFPQFLGEAKNPTVQLIFLCAIFIVVSAIWLTVLVFTAHAMRKFMTTVGFTISMEFIVGFVFVLLSVSLLVSGVSLTG